VTDHPVSPPARRRPRLTPPALIGAAAAAEVGLFASSIGSEIADGEPGTRVFWFVLSLLLLLGILRRSRTAWSVFLAVGFAVVALGLYAAPGPATLAPLSLVAVQLAALLHPQVRAHVKVAGTGVAPERPQVEVDDAGR
jgi:hypothetical protein